MILKKDAMKNLIENKELNDQKFSVSLNISSGYSAFSEFTSSKNDPWGTVSSLSR